MPLILPACLHGSIHALNAFRLACYWCQVSIWSLRCTHIWLCYTALLPQLPHTAAIPYTAASAVPASACVQAAGKAVDMYGSLGRGRILRILADKMGRAGTAEVGSRGGRGGRGGCRGSAVGSRCLLVPACQRAVCCVQVQ